MGTNDKGKRFPREVGTSSCSESVRSTQLPNTRLVSFVKREKYISLLDIRGDAATRTGEAVSHMRYWDHAEKRHGQRQCIFLAKQKRSPQTAENTKISSFQELFYFILSWGRDRGEFKGKPLGSENEKKNKLNPRTSLVAPTWKATALATGRSLIFTLRTRGVTVNSCNASQLISLELERRRPEFLTKTRVSFSTISMSCFFSLSFNFIFLVNQSFRY